MQEQIEAIYDDFTHFKFRISIRMLEIEKAVEEQNGRTSVKKEHHVAMSALQNRIDEVVEQNKTLAKNYLSLKAINEGLYKEVEELRAKLKPSEIWKIRNSTEKVYEENKELRRQLDEANKQLETSNKKLADAAALKTAHQQLQDELAESKVHNSDLAKRNLQLQYKVDELQVFNDTLEQNAVEYRAMMDSHKKLKTNFELCMTTVLERTLEVCALQQQIADAKAKADERDQCYTKIIHGLRNMLQKRAK